MWTLLAASEDPLLLGSAASFKAPLLMVLILSHGRQITQRSFMVPKVMVLIVGPFSALQLMENETRFNMLDFFCGEAALLRICFQLSLTPSNSLQSKCGFCMFIDLQCNLFIMFR